MGADSMIDALSRRIQERFGKGGVDAVTQAGPASSGPAAAAGAAFGNAYTVRRAEYFTPLDNGDVNCGLCPNKCRIPPGGKGVCLTRKNEDGALYNICYGKTLARAIPIASPEFPVLYHGLEGLMALIGLAGCGLRCSFCFAWQTAQADPENVNVPIRTPEWILENAQKNGLRYLHFSNNEPTNNFEFTRDVAGMAREQGLLTGISTAGWVNPEPLDALSGLFNSFIFGLKAFTESNYKKYTRGSLQTVLDNMLLVKSRGAPIEITYLVIPSVTDSVPEIKAMASWVSENISPYTPVFLNRFYPMYKMKNLPPTPLSTMNRALAACREGGLKFAMPHVPFRDRSVLTDPEWDGAVRCPYCGKTLLEYVFNGPHDQLINNVEDGKCRFCGNPTPGLSNLFESQRLD